MKGELDAVVAGHLCIDLFPVFRHRAKAVADLGWVKLTGYPAWLAWLFLHLVFLIGFKNRIVVLVQWLVAYVTRQRGVRLITRDS